MDTLLGCQKAMISWLPGEQSLWEHAVAPSGPACKLPFPQKSLAVTGSLWHGQ